jgi:hypothetical protein
MVHAFPSRDHLTDGELLERLLARRSDPHVAACARCAERAETIARAVDARRAEDPAEFDAAFYQRQAAAIHARLARRERLLGVPRLGWAAVAAAVLMAVALRGPALIGRHPGAVAIRSAAPDEARRLQDRADERLLRRVDDTLDADPYDIELDG